MSDINKIMEAYLGMVSARDAELEEGCGKKSYKENQEECPKCDGDGCPHCDGKGYHEVSEKKLDPVDDKENDKKFKNRKDKDIDNDGDVDSSDEYLHKRRKATSDAMKDKVDEVSADLAKAAAKSKEADAHFMDRGHGKMANDGANKAATDAKARLANKTMSQKYAEYKRGGGKLSMDDWKKRAHEALEVDLTDSFESLWEAISEAANPKKDALAPEKYDDHSSKHDKEVIAKHKKSDKKIEDNEEDGHDKTFAAAKAVKKQAPARSGADNLSNGDKSVVNPVKGK